MNKTVAALIVAISIFSYAADLLAWSDDVSGVLMPEPRGGGGISDQDIEAAVNTPPDTGSEEPHIEVEWE